MTKGENRDEKTRGMAKMVVAKRLVTFPVDDGFRVILHTSEINQVQPLYTQNKNVLSRNIQPSSHLYIYLEKSCIVFFEYIQSDTKYFIYTTSYCFKT